MKARALLLGVALALWGQAQAQTAGPVQTATSQPAGSCRTKVIWEFNDLGVTEHWCCIGYTPPSTPGTWTQCDPAGGGGGAPINATYITQTAHGTLTAEQALAALATGLVKSTTGTGVLSIATSGTDFQAPILGIKYATDGATGAGSSGSPWLGWSVNLAADRVVIFAAGIYESSAAAGYAIPSNCHVRCEPGATIRFPGSRTAGVWLFDVPSTSTNWSVTGCTFAEAGSIDTVNGNSDGGGGYVRAGTADSSTQITFTIQFNRFGPLKYKASGPAIYSETVHVRGAATSAAISDNSFDYSSAGISFDGGSDSQPAITYTNVDVSRNRFHYTAGFGASAGEWPLGWIVFGSDLAELPWTNLNLGRGIRIADNVFTGFANHQLSYLIDFDSLDISRNIFALDNDGDESILVLPTDNAATAFGEGLTAVGNIARTTDTVGTATLDFSVTRSRRVIIANNHLSTKYFNPPLFLAAVEDATVIGNDLEQHTTTNSVVKIAGGNRITLLGNRISSPAGSSSAIEIARNISTDPQNLKIEHNDLVIASGSFSSSAVDFDPAVVACTGCALVENRIVGGGPLTDNFALWSEVEGNWGGAETTIFHSEQHDFAGAIKLGDQLTVQPNALGQNPYAYEWPMEAQPTSGLPVVPVYRPYEGRPSWQNPAGLMEDAYRHIFPTGAGTGSATDGDRVRDTYETRIATVQSATNPQTLTHAWSFANGGLHDTAKGGALQVRWRLSGLNPSGNCTSDDGKIWWDDDGELVTDRTLLATISGVGSNQASAWQIDTTPFHAAFADLSQLVVQAEINSASTGTCRVQVDWIAWNQSPEAVGSVASFPLVAPTRTWPQHAILPGPVALGGATLATASCAGTNSDRLYGDVDCDGIKDVGEEFLDNTSTGGTNHNLLSTTHPDSAAGTVVRGDLITGNSTPAWARFALGAADTVLQSNAAGTDPEWGKLGDENMFGEDFGDWSCTGAEDGCTVDADAITYAKFQNIANTDRLLGRDTAGAGDVEELTVGGGVEFSGSGGIQRSALTGEVAASAGSGTTTIADSVTVTGWVLGTSSATALTVPSLLSNTDVTVEVDADSNGSESFQVLDGASAIVLEVQETGDTQIDGVLTSDGTGTSDFDGPVTAPSFVADDRTTEPGNKLGIFDNETAFTNDPTCANSGLSGELTIIDSNETATDQWDVCDGTSLRWRFPATSTAATYPLFDTATAGVTQFRAIADSDIPDTITVANYLPLAGGTLTGQLVADNLGIEFEDSDTNPSCAAGNYNIFADLSETTLKKCLNGVVSVLDTGGGSVALTDLTDVTLTSPATGATLIKSAGDWVDGQLDLADADAVTGVLPAANVGNGLTDTQVNDDLTLTNLTQITTRDVDNLQGLGDIDTELVLDGVEVDFDAGTANAWPRLLNETTPTGTDCDAAGEAGRLLVDPDADTDGSVLFCRGAAGWKDIDDDGGAGTAEFTDEGTILRPADATDDFVRMSGDTNAPAIGSDGSKLLFDPSAQASPSGKMTLAWNGSTTLTFDRFSDVGNSIFDFTNSGTQSAQLQVDGVDVLNASNTATLTGKTYDADGTGNVLTIPSKIWLPAAGCNNATAAPMFDLPASNAPAIACLTGKGVADFDGTTDETMQTTLMLPADWTGNVDVAYKWLSTVTTGNVTWCAQVVCVADSETDSQSFAAQATGNCVSDATKGTTNQTNDAADTAITITGCAAGEMLNLQISRDPNETSTLSDTLAGDARLIGIELTVRRAI